MTEILVIALGSILTVVVMIFAIINFKLPTNDPEREWYSKQLEKEYRKLRKS